MNKKLSYQAGILAAKRGNNINNSYPHDHEEFVRGYKSVSPAAEENLALKKIAIDSGLPEYKDLELSPEQVYKIMDDKAKSKYQEMIALLDSIDRNAPLIRRSDIVSIDFDKANELYNTLNSIKEFFESLKP